MTWPIPFIAIVVLAIAGGLTSCLLDLRAHWRTEHHHTNKRKGTHMANATRTIRKGDRLQYGKRTFKVLGRYTSLSGEQCQQAAQLRAQGAQVPFYSVLVEPEDERVLPSYMQRHYITGDPPRTFRLPEAHYFVLIAEGGWKLI